jgi:hypothetical protein
MTRHEDRHDDDGTTGPARDVDGDTSPLGPGTTAGGGAVRAGERVHDTAPVDDPDDADRD